MMSEADREAAKEACGTWPTNALFFTKEGGCDNGDACAYCHVHPRTNAEQTSACQQWSERQQCWVPRGRRERKAHLDYLNEAQPWRQRLLEEKRILLARVRHDWAHNVCLGESFEQVHFAFWTVSRLSAHAFQCRKRMSDIFSAQGMYLPVNHIGIWYGVDKLSDNPGHYAAGTKRHGVHTLMKGLAARLEVLAAQVDAQTIILMEGDCTCVPNFPQMLQQLLRRGLLEQDFCWLGFFTNQRPNKYTGAKHDRDRRDQGPLFYGHCNQKMVHPDYGCHMFSLKRSWIPAMCKRMRESKFPHGFDRWIFSPNFCENSKCSFVNWSLAGQLYDQSDSWADNTNVGEVEQPRDDWRMAIRNFDESAELQSRRKSFWQKHQTADKGARKKSRLGSREELATWNQRDDVPAGKRRRQVPPPADSLGAATTKAPPVQMISDTESESEDARITRSLWAQILNLRAPDLATGAPARSSTD